MSSIRASLVEAGAKVRIITGRASGKEVFFRGFPKKKGKGLVFRTVTEEGRAGGSEYINKIWGGKKRNRMRATGKKDAGRLKAGCGQRGKRMWERGKGLAKGREKGWGKEGKVAQKGKKDG